MADEYVILDDWQGYQRGDVISIGNPNTVRRWLRDGRILPADHPLLAANMAQPPSVNAGLLYRLAQMTVNDLTEAVAAVDDPVVLRVIVENDGRSGARLAADGRLATLDTTE